MREPSLTILTPHRGGRPRIAESRTSVSTWISARTHDWIIREAKAREQSVSAFVRELLTLCADPTLGRRR